jgi:hypothetical protein
MIYEAQKEKAESKPRSVFIPESQSAWLRQTCQQA